MAAGPAVKPVAAAMAAGPAVKPVAGEAITETSGRLCVETRFAGPLGKAVNPPYMMHYGVHFTKHMDERDIRDIILELAHRALLAIVNRGMDHDLDNFVVMFEAAYVSWGPTDPELWQIKDAGELASRVLKLGWDDLCALPSIWVLKQSGI